MNSAQQFFFDYAGYSYNPETQSEFVGRVCCAIALADAEAWAVENGAICEWYDDDEPADCQREDGSWEQLPAMYCCLLMRCDDCSLDFDTATCVERCTRKRGYHVQACLGGIVESDDYRERRAYRRVVEAELASEAYTARTYVHKVPA